LRPLVQGWLYIVAVYLLEGEDLVEETFPEEHIFPLVKRFVVLRAIGSLFESIFVDRGVEGSLW
jgi:hypothetical protein